MKKLLMLILALNLLLAACGNDAAQEETPVAPPPVISTAADGTVVETVFHTNGQVAAETRTRPNGEQGTEYFTEDGSTTQVNTDAQGNVLSSGLMAE